MNENKIADTNLELVTGGASDLGYETDFIYDNLKEAVNLCTDDIPSSIREDVVVLLDEAYQGLDSNFKSHLNSTLTEIREFMDENPVVPRNLQTIRGFLLVVQELLGC